jgi:hypothetical protein
MKRHRSVAIESVASPSESAGAENDRLSSINYQSLKTASPSGGGMAGLLLQTGIVKTTTQANAVLLSIVGIVIVLIVWLNWPRSPAIPAASLNQPSSVATP